MAMTHGNVYHGTGLSDGSIKYHSLHSDANALNNQALNDNHLIYLNLIYVPFQQSHFLRANALRVGLPLESFIGPGIPPILAQNDLRLAAAFGDFFACLADTGGFKFMPCAFAEARPFAFNPPLGFFPFLALPCRSLSHCFSSSFVLLVFLEQFQKTLLHFLLLVFVSSFASSCSHIINHIRIWASSFLSCGFCLCLLCWCQLFRLA